MKIFWEPRWSLWEWRTPDSGAENTVGESICTAVFPAVALAGAQKQLLNVTLYLTVSGTFGTIDVGRPRGAGFFWRSDEVPVSQFDDERMPRSGFGKAVLLTRTEQRRIENSVPGTDCRQNI